MDGRRYWRNENVSALGSAWQVIRPRKYLEMCQDSGLSTGCFIVYYMMIWQMSEFRAI
jgi:hypothetical protein